MPRKSRATGGALDPQRLPSLLIAALDSLYDHYAKTFELWREAKLPVPPTFIIVCQNTAVSKLVYDYIAGYWVGRTNGGDADENAENDAGGGANTGIAGAGGRFRSGRFPLFHNFDENGNALARPNTLLIDSEQLEAGDALDKEFRSAAGDEIERFRRDIVERTGSVADAEKITDQQLLREVMNTVGKEGKLGGQIRCVVSVSMLTEGWDANTVTHILGVRAFRTQLLCEQVVGRALRRLSYELEDAEKKFFGVEYANILGIPFEFTKAPATNTKPVPPKPVTLVRAVVPERDELEIVFPRLEGYRIEPPDTTLTATFNDDSALLLTPEVVGPNQVLLAGIVGEKMQLTPEFLRSIRAATIVFHLTTHLLQKHFQDKNGEPELQFFGQAKRIVAEWVETKLRCAGGAFPAQVLYEQIADNACQLINDAITRSCVGTGSGSGSGTDKKRRERSEKHESDSPCFRAV
jgi:type III restriction enzyme